jgi:hypothetical protein
MKLVGDYIYRVYYLLPDGSKIDIDRLIDFSLNDNYEAVDRLDDHPYFDCTIYGCLEEEYIEITKCFKKMSLIDDFCKIIDKDKIEEYLNDFTKDATKLINDKESYIRETRINDVLKKD